MKFHLATYGCTANRADSELLAGLLTAAGHSPAPEKEADLLILNTCTVKAATEQKIANRLRKLANSKKRVLVAGCMAQAQPGLVRRSCPEASLLGTFELSRVAEAVGRIAKGERVELIGTTPVARPSVKLRSDPVAAIVPIAQGCKGACTYCIARLARGELRSFPEDEILADVECALADGCKEIRLTSQDNTVYGQDTGTDIVRLLERIVALPGDFRVRIGMMNPSGFGKLLPGLLKIYGSEKVYTFFHIPVQSGSDKILKAMGRRYARKDFVGLVSKIRRKFPLASIATDVIVGYPLETEEDFQQTVELLKETCPDVVNISRFTGRPGTPAAAFTPLRTQILKGRSRRMSELCDALAVEHNKNYVGLKDRVLVTEKGRKGKPVGRSSFYKVVLLPKGKLGEFVDVKFGKSGITCLN